MTSVDSHPAPTFSERLRLAADDDWRAAVHHRFVDELLAGSVDDDVMRAYLVQDYQFIDGFVALLGAAVAHADQFSSRLVLSRFLAMITSDENTYFQRAFDTLGVAASHYEAAEPGAPTRGFQDLMGEAVRSGSYARCLSVLVVAEWLYLSWAQRRSGALPEKPVHAEWITLHDNPYFSGFVDWLRREFDRVGEQLSAEDQAAVTRSFTRAVALERAFFDQFYPENR
jgi:Putative transcription activator